MPKSSSYKQSKCCGGLQDCDYLDGGNLGLENWDGKTCWGQVEMTSLFDDEDGRPFPNHLCQGHIVISETDFDVMYKAEYTPENVMKSLEGGYVSQS
jgi:hypothetical protein